MLGDAWIPSAMGGSRRLSFLGRIDQQNVPANSCLKSLVCMVNLHSNRLGARLRVALSKCVRLCVRYSQIVSEVDQSFNSIMLAVHMSLGRRSYSQCRLLISYYPHMKRTFNPNGIVY